jgi:REP element-mobilizing transposase RayT
MARPLRIQYPGAVYHVTCRGIERRKIFLDDKDREKFLRLLSLSLNIYSAKLHAYVLMDNHFHLLVETPLGNLGEFMRHFNITYTGYFTPMSGAGTWQCKCYRSQSTSSMDRREIFL